ncbi:MAG: MFS transporter [Verrucomicrobiota bacterium]
MPKRDKIFRTAFAPEVPFRYERLPFFYGWLVTVGATLGVLFSIPGQTMGFSVFTEILMNELGLSRMALSSAYFFGTVASGLTLPALGKLFDHWGARRMIVLSSAATGVVLLYLSEVADLARWLVGVAPWMAKTVVAFALITIGFYLIRLAAQGVLTMTSRNVVGKWFDHRRGMAMAISGVFVSFGFSVAPRFLNQLIEIFGYDGAWRLLALLTLALMLPLGWLIFRDNPEECGLEMDGGKVETGRAMNLDMVIHREYTRQEALKTYALYVFNLSFGFIALFSTAFTFHIESIGQEFGFTKSRIIEFFLPMAVISVFANLTAGWINSRIRLKYLLLTMNLGSVLGALGLLFLNSTLGVVAYVVGNGLAGGIFASLIGLVWPRFYGRQWLGAISGLAMSCMVVASGIGPWLFALSRSLTGSYQLVLMVMITLPTVLCVASVWAENPQRKRGGSKAI